MTSSILEIGVYSIRLKVQKRLKNKFTVRKETKNSDGVIIGITYLLPDRSVHRDSRKGPAFAIYYDDGNPKNEFWVENYVLYREDGPSYIEYYDNGQIMEEIWHTGESRRILIILKEYVREVSSPGHFIDQIYRETWYNKRGKIFRKDKPANILYKLLGESVSSSESKVGEKQKLWEEWYTREDELHREDRPARIEYNEDGSIGKEEWYNCGVLVPK